MEFSWGGFFFEHHNLYDWTRNNQAPVVTAEYLVMTKQICAVLVNGAEQSEYWGGIKLGLNDTVASTITIGFDLKG